MDATELGGVIAACTTVLGGVALMLRDLRTSVSKLSDKLDTMSGKVETRLDEMRDEVSAVDGRIDVLDERIRSVAAMASGFEEDLTPPLGRRFRRPRTNPGTPDK